MRRGAAFGTALVALGLAAALAACGLLGSTASTVGSGASLASQGSGASSRAVPDIGGGDEAAAEEGPVGRICGTRAIRGRVLPEIEGEGACGVKAPVRVASVNGIVLMPEPVVTCETATALEAWVSEVAIPVFDRSGDPLRSIEIAAHYICGPADAPGHASGEAVDISSFGLESGEAYVVSRDWQDPLRGVTLGDLHIAACGPFEGTLGPRPDGLHAVSLHYDVAGSGRLTCQ